MSDWVYEWVVEFWWLGVLVVGFVGDFMFEVSV